MSKCRKRPWNLYKHKTSFFKKTYFSLIIEQYVEYAYGMFLKFLQKSRCLGWFKTIQAKTRLNSSKDNFIAKSFRLSTKRKLSILLNFLFPFVSFIGVFSILKCKTLVLKTTTSWTRASHFVDGWHLQRCQISFFPHPPPPPPSKWLTWPLDVFERVAGMGDFTDLVCIGRIFSQTSLKFFFQHYTSWAIYFFQCRIFFTQEFICMLFSSRNQSAGHFSEITHNPLKSQMVGPQNPPNIWSVDRFWFVNHF